MIHACDSKKKRRRVATHTALELLRSKRSIIIVKTSIGIMENMDPILKQPTERPRTGSQRKRPGMNGSNSSSIPSDVNTESIRRPKSAPKPITPSTKNRPTTKTNVKNDRNSNFDSNINSNRSRSRPKRARKKRPSGPPLKGSKNDLLAKRLGLRSFKNTTPQDLQIISTMNVSTEDAKALGKIAVSEKNWELAEIAYNLCVEKPPYSTEGRSKGHQEELYQQQPLNGTGNYPRLSPIKTRGRYGRPHTQQSFRNRSRRQNRSSHTKLMLDYEQNWRNGTAHASWNSTSSRRSSMDSKVLRSSTPKLFNFLDNENPPPFMSRETLLRLSAPKKHKKPPPLNNIPCEASGRWKGRQGGRFSTSKPKSDVEWIIYRSKQVPGPSHYRPKLVKPKVGVKFSDANPKGDVDWIIHRSKQTPGPGQYALKSTLASGGVKFSDANPKSDLEWTIYNASQVPGPARYNIELCP